MKLTEEGSKLIKEVDKVGVATEVCKHPANLDVLDLRDRVSHLVEFLRRANRQPA